MPEAFRRSTLAIAAAVLTTVLSPAYGARVVSHWFHMGDWKSEADVRLEGTHVYRWTIREQ